jgi:hypothetical protein
VGVVTIGAADTTWAIGANTLFFVSTIIFTNCATKAGSINGVGGPANATSRGVVIYP